MAYLRRRTIGNGTYLYVVESRWHAGKVRQVTLEYLGRDPAPRRLKRALRYWGVKAKPEKGEGREETYSTFRRVRTLRNDLARTAGRFIGEPAPAKLQQAQGALDQLAPFYAEEDSAATAS